MKIQLSIISGSNVAAAMIGRIGRALADWPLNLPKQLARDGKTHDENRRDMQRALRQRKRHGSGRGVPSLMYVNGGIAEVEKCRGGDFLSPRAMAIAVVFNDKRAQFGIEMQP